MSEIVTVREDLGIVEVRAPGYMIIQDMIEMQASVVRICQEREIYKVLIDARDGNIMPDTFQLFQFGLEVIDSGILRRIKFAVLPSKAIAEDIQFIETVVHNRSKIYIQMFDSEDAALAWLNP